jgi:rod shape-determining protein MreC
VAVYRRSRRHRFVLLLLVLTSVTVITLDFRDGGGGAVETIRQGVRDVFAPVESAADAVFSPVGDFFGGLTRYSDVKAENSRLRRELDQARSENLRQAGAERDLQNLMDLQHLEFAGNIPSVAARVISTAPSNFQMTVTIDKGSDQGIEKGMPVVAGAGLVGRIQETSKSSAVVMLITDQESNVGIKLQASGDIGVARGGGASQQMPVDFVDVSTKVEVGAAVVTSGLQQSVFPPELPVGRVVRASAAPGALQQDVTIEPVVDLRRLEFVRVLQWKPQPGP